MPTQPAGTCNTGVVASHYASFGISSKEIYKYRQLRLYFVLCYNQIMDDDKILEITSSIEGTLGQETFATISDKIGELLTGNSENMKALADRDAEIDKLRDRNEKLVAANGALLQKVPMGYKAVDKQKEKEENPQPKLSLKDAFDSKGNFRK